MPGRGAFPGDGDIAGLLDLLNDAQRGVPPFSDRLDELNPYAIEARYGLVEPSALDRAVVSRMVEAVVTWAETQLARPIQR